MWHTGKSAAAGWSSVTAATHVVAAAWRPATPVVLCAWLICGLAVPTGQLRTAARRVTAGVSVISSAAATVALAADRSVMRPAGWFVAAALAVAGLALAAAAIASRHATTADRRMLRWLAATVVVTLALDTVLVALHFLVDTPDDVGPWLVVVLVLVPLGQAIAAWPPAMRAADRIFVESVVAAAFALFVVAVYLVVVVGLGHVPVEEERDVLVSSFAAAVVIAVLALPVRQRALRISSRFVSNTGATAEQALTVGARMTRAVPMDELLLQITESLHATVGAGGAEIWVGQDGVLSRTVSVPSRPLARIELGSKERVVVARARMGGHSWTSVWLPALLADGDAGGHSGNGVRADLRVAPISHLGELLGLVVARRPADAAAFSEDDERLLVDLARQLGLALHNVRLDSALQASLDELKRRNAELQASRLRIVTAADESRRAIERNLHDGAQQYLVALAVKLNLAGQVAQDDPSLLVDMLEQLRGDVQATIRELRELAHGIYPPLLRDRGLGEALRTATNRSPLPCDLDVDLPGRYPEDVETAVYFCCLEALQNAGKHAGAEAQITVRVRGDQEEISFAVEDNGAGFDSGGETGHGFLNMQDRLGAVNGRLEVASEIATGTTIRGVIPAAPVTLPAQPVGLRTRV
jgi:signal transduction histidine kinase